MKAYVITTPIGVFGIDEKNQILKFILFKKNFKEIAKKLLKAEREILDEEKKVYEFLKKKEYDVYFNFRKEGKKFEKNSLAEKFLKENLRDIAIKEKFFKNAEEFNEFIVRVSIEISKEKIRKSVGKDVFVMQTVRAIEELDKMINVFVERLREWYGLHFPELERGIENHKKLVEIVSKYGRRENIREWERLAKDSIGVKISKEDEEILKKYASYILNLFSLRESLERYLENLLKDVAPNLQAVAGTTLAARLINKAGGLEKLAKMASSTIQLIGAEKALFRYLRGKGKSPKHGIIFTHPYVMKAPRKLRGKIARALASKLSMAAKMDFYTKEFRGDVLKKELEKKVREILEKGK